MVDEKQTPQPQPDANDAPSPAAATTHIAPSPHVGDRSRSTRWMMCDVVLALLPAVGMSLYVFGSGAMQVILISVASCMATEVVFQLVIDGSPN